jgi:hypothetical protein
MTERESTMNQKKILAITGILSILAAKKWKDINNDGDEDFLSTRQVIKREGLLSFIDSRLLTPKEIVVAIKDINEDHEGLKHFTLKEFIWHARYVNFKAIEDYDFI